MAFPQPSALVVSPVGPSVLSSHLPTPPQNRTPALQTANQVIGAGKGHYIGIGGWNDPTYNKLDTHWQPEFDLPLGDPASEGEYSPATATWTRRFQSALVTFNAKTNVGAIQWGSASPGLNR